MTVCTLETGFTARAVSKRRLRSGISSYASDECLMTLKRFWSVCSQPKPLKSSLAPNRTPARGEKKLFFNKTLAELIKFYIVLIFAIYIIYFILLLLLLDQKFKARMEVSLSNIYYNTFRRKVILLDRHGTFMIPSSIYHSFWSLLASTLFRPPRMH